MAFIATVVTFAGIGYTPNTWVTGALWYLSSGIAMGVCFGSVNWLIVFFAGRMIGVDRTATMRISISQILVLFLIVAVVIVRFRPYLL